MGPAYSKSTHWVLQHIPWLLIALIALHASGALFHHYVLKDTVLRRMVRAA